MAKGIAISLLFEIASNRLFATVSLPPHRTLSKWNHYQIEIASTCN
jgi:hypothetical protein